MKVHGDIESVNLSTGECYQRVAGDGESRLVPCRGPVDFARLGPQRDVVFGPDESEPTADEIVRRAKQLLDLARKGFVMHYRNGREAKNGDKVVQFGCDSSQIITVGILHEATPGNDYCNGKVAPTLPSGVQGACMCDCLHYDDLVELLKEKGLDKRPAGK